MANIAEALTTPAMVVESWHETHHKPRARLGLSEIGHKCPRYLWQVHHGIAAAPLSGRVKRLFRLGEMVEEQVVLDLMAAGYHVHSRQKEISFEYGALSLKGHIDGVIEGLLESVKPHLLEVKTSSAKRFAALKKVGYERWDEKYKAQVHVYMLGMRLDRALVWVECKDNSEVHTERVRLDRDYAVSTLERVFDVIAGAMPERLCPSAAWFEAKWCNFYKSCF